MRHNIGAVWSAWFMLLKFYGRSIGDELVTNLEFRVKCSRTDLVDDVYYMEYIDYVVLSKE